MQSKLINKVFGFLAMGLLFTSVACSHKRAVVSELEGLSQEESTTAEATTENPVESKETEKAPVSENTVVPEEAKEADVAKVPESTENNVAPTEAAVTKEAEAVPNEFAVPAPVVSSTDLADQVKADLQGVGEPQKKAPVTTLVARDFNSKTQSDLDDVGGTSKRKKKKKHRVRGRHNELSRWDELVEAAKVAKNAQSAEEAKEEELKNEQLASPSISSVIERNLFWFALAIVGGLVSAFLSVRRNRKSSDTKF